MRNIRGDWADYHNELWRLIQKRESKTGIVETNTGIEKCNCGELWIRAVESFHGSGRVTDWQKLVEGGNADLPANDKNQQYEAKVENGTCDSYSVSIFHRKMPADVNPGTSREIDSRHPSPEGLTNGKNFNLNIHYVPSMNFVQDPMLVIVMYPVIDEKDIFAKKRGVVELDVSGKKGGNICCKKTYRIK